MQKADVVIIGSGVLGYSLALALAREDSTLNIIVLGNKDKKGNATQAAGAMLGCFGEITETMFKSKYGKAKFKSSLEAKKLWGDWTQFVNEISQKNIRINKGTFIVHNTNSGHIDTKNYRAIKQKLIENNEEFEESYFEDIPGIHTLENLRSLDSIFIPNEGSICASLYLDALQKAIENLTNIKLICEEVSSIEVNNEKAQRIKLCNNEYIETPKLVLAAGAFSQHLIDQIPELHNKIPRILAGVGHSILVSQTTPSIEHVIRTPNRAGACGLHVLPYNGHLYVGATNELKIHPETEPTVGWIHFLLQCLLDQINQNLFSSKISKIMIGNRPSPLDGFPLLGYTSINNLFMLTGTYRDGFHQSPYLAKIAAQNILYNTPMLDGLFSPERKPIEIMTRQEAIDEAVEHHMASAYEAGAKFPHAFWSESMKNYIKNDITEFYDTFGVNTNLLPEQTLMMRDHRLDQNFVTFFKNYFAKTSF